MGKPKYRKQLITNIKKRINSNTVIVGGSHISSTLTNRSAKHKTQTVALNDTRGTDGFT